MFYRELKKLLSNTNLCSCQNSFVFSRKKNAKNNQYFEKIGEKNYGIAIN